MRIPNVGAMTKPAANDPAIAPSVLSAYTPPSVDATRPVLPAVMRAVSGKLAPIRKVGTSMNSTHTRNTVTRPPTPMARTTVYISPKSGSSTTADMPIATCAAPSIAAGLASRSTRRAM